MVVKILYGYDAASEDDKYIALIDKTLQAEEAFVSGTFMVEFLPWLRYVPRWFPGAGFQKTFAEWRRCAHEVKNDMVANTAEGMVTSAETLSGCYFS